MPITNESREISARVAHEALSSLRMALGESLLPAWVDAPPWMRERTYKLVDAVRSEITPTSPEAEHTRWYNERVEVGWTHGPVRDDAAKVNPLLLPWSALSKDARRIAIAKTAVQIGVVEALTAAFSVPLE